MRIFRGNEVGHVGNRVGRLQQVARIGGIMGLKWTAKLNVEFEMMDDRLQPENLARIVLMREVAQFRLNIERGLGVGPTGVKRNTAQVEIVAQGPAPN